MKTIKELEVEYADVYGRGYNQARKDVLGLIDERYAGHGILCTCKVCEYRRKLKARIKDTIKQEKMFWG